MHKKIMRTKEREKRAKKKGFKYIFWLLAVGVVFWVLTAWYLGTKAEQAFRAYLQTHSQVVGKKLLRVELLSYRKTLFGAKAQLRLSSDISVISERLGEVVIDARLLNGPLFITKNGVSVGSSRWFLKIDTAHLSEQESENIHAIFPEALPIAIVRTDFKQNAHYFAKLQTNFSQMLVTGVYAFETEQQDEHNRGAITLDDFSYGILPNKLSADKIKISYQHQKAISASYKPGTTSVQIPALQIHHKSLQNPVIVSLSAKSNLSNEGDFLKGFLKIDLEQSKNQGEVPVDTANISLLFKGLSAEGLIAFSEASADLDNLKQQVNWTLEDLGEFPEGRDEIINLFDRIDTSSKALNQLIVKGIFQDKDSVIQLKTTAQQNNVNSNIKAELNTVDTAVPNGNSFLSLINGEMQGDLSDQLHEFISAYLQSNEMFKKMAVKKQFKLRIKDNKLLIQ